MVPPLTSSKKRERAYYFFDKKGAGEWTDEMTRFIISDNQIRQDKVVKIENNKPAKYFKKYPRRKR